MLIGADEKFKNCMVRRTFGGFVPWGPCCFVPLFARELLCVVLFSVERSDSVGGPRGGGAPLAKCHAIFIPCTV